MSVICDTDTPVASVERYGADGSYRRAREPAGQCAAGNLATAMAMQALDSADQAALLDHAAEMARASFSRMAFSTSPNGELMMR